MGIGRSLAVANAPMDSMLVLLRVAAFTQGSLEAVQSPGILGQARSAEAAHSRLERRRVSRTAALHALVCGREGPDRLTLLELKRAVHNDRVPVPRLCSAMASLPPALRREAGDLDSWLSDVRRYRAALDEGPATVTSDWRNVRRGLARLWREELLRRGVLHAKPQLFRDLERHFAGTRHWIDEPRKRIELGLLSYVYRTASKTSPFSTLTVLAHAQPGDDHAAFPVLDLADRQLTAIIPPPLASRLARHMVELGEIAEPIGLPPVRETNPDRLRFIGETDGATEAVRTIAGSPVALIAAGVLETAEQPPTHAGLRTALAELLRCGEERIGPALSSLREAGLLQPLQPCAPCRPDALEQIAKAMREGAMRDRMSELIGALRAEQGACACGRARSLTLASATLAGLLDDPEGEAVSEIAFDRCMLAEIVPMPAGTLDATMRGLARVLALLPLFNIDLGGERLVQDHLRARCGDGEILPVLDGFAQLCASLAGAGEDEDGFLAAAEAHPASRYAAAERTALLGELAALIAGRAHCAPVVIPDSMTDRWIDRARPFAAGRSRLGATFLGQFIDCRTPDSPIFALNAAITGYGALMAGAADSVSQGPAGRALRDRLAKRLRELDADGIVAEVAASLGFGGQVRERIADYVLPYPGEPSPVDRAAALDWQSLGLGLDPALDRVVLMRRRDRRPVLPVHLGTISPRHFPPFYRFIIALGPAFTPSFNLVELLEGELPDGARDSVRTYPQLLLGPIAITRRSWCVPARMLPAAPQGTPGFGDFLALRGWAAELGIPRRTFVSAVQTVDLVREKLEVGDHRRARKPIYLDLDDFASSVLFWRVMRRSGPTVRFTEMLPDPDNNPFRGQDGTARVVEAAIDLMEAASS